MYPGFELHFEMTIRSFLGNDADHIANQAFDDTSRKRWYAKALKKVIGLINDLDTTTRHKEQMILWAESSLNAVTKEFDEQKLLLYLFRLSGSLLGFSGIKGSMLHTPIYSQTHGQYYTEETFSGGDVMQDYYDKENIIAVRRSLVLELKIKGFTDFKIGQILNISEYQVKKLRKSL
jgi:hypothetical protein